jgi:hypothetical protein
MKKIILSTMLLGLSITSFCQQTQPSTSSTQEEYLNKSKKQKKVASVLLVGGTVLMGTSLLFLIIANKESVFPIGSLFFGIGAVSTVVSIPLFIASGRNKRKSKNASVSFNFEKYQSIQQSKLSFHSVPAISIKLNL